MDGGNFEDDITDVIRLVTNLFEEAYLGTTGGKEIESNIFIPQVSAITRLLTSNDGDLPSYFDKNNRKNINDNETKTH